MSKESVPIPAQMSRNDAVEGLREMLRMAEEFQRVKDLGFVRWPDAHALIDYIAQYGFPPPETTQEG